MDNIKLIIWDLDETFWKGTLSDGEIEPIESNIEFVKTMTDRGIINSICSKNDFEKTKAKLEELGVYEYFVFPSIDWTPKGNRVKNIITQMQLRPINCLFLDDNINNLQEAKFITPELQTATPDKIESFLNDSAFKGKDDSSHSRLAQYKILEQKAEEKSHFASNDDFLFQSEIQVELIEDCSDKLERIFEMIHRNNQLNFTKDRISQEEVNKIFTDKNIRSGVVHVKDKYGDHGIIGCYAVKDKKAIQFVFSCRILGMGVEQWVYAELGYPEINIVGEVASELPTSGKPKWINQTITNSQQVQEPENQTTPRLVVYGTCPLRPVWAYLEPKLKNAKFAEIDPAPPICNLGKPLFMSDKIQKDLVDHVKFLSDYSFDKQLKNGEFDYILITLQYDVSQAFKYTSKSSKTYFYSKNLNGEFADASIINNFEARKATLDDIEEELSYFAKHIPKTSKILIQTVSEVVFYNSKDNDWKQRVAVNELAERLAKKFENIHLIDIRKYAKSQSDFFDAVPNHYNRQIGHTMANEILEYMGVLNNKKIETAKKESNQIPKDAVVETKRVDNFLIKEFKCTSYVKNFKYTVQLEVPNKDKFQFRYFFFYNRFVSARTEFDENSSISFDISKPGKYHVAFSILNKETGEKVDFATKDVMINEYNYYKFIDETCDLETIKDSIKVFCDTQEYDQTNFENHSAQLATILANGINLSDYFFENGITEISVYTDMKYGKLILPLLHNSNIKIKNIFYDEYLWSISINGKRLGAYNYNLLEINSTPKLNKNDVLLFAVSANRRFNFRLFSKTNCIQLYLPNILNSLYTKIFFTDCLKNKINVPKILALKIPEMYRHDGDKLSYSSLKGSEKSLMDYKIFNNKDALARLKSNSQEVTETIKNLDRNVLLETLVTPEMYNDEATKIPMFRDINGKYLNIKDGFRVTTNQPKIFDKSIYIMGDATAFGCGVKDSETIASYLQNLVNKNVRVVNYSNIWPVNEYSKVLELFEHTYFKKDDIVVFLIFNKADKLIWNKDHWLDFESLTDPVIKIDTIDLFKNIDRPDYFIAPNAYTKECNEALANLIFEKINND